jgi:hypothetical protein
VLPVYETPDQPEDKHASDNFASEPMETTGFSLTLAREPGGYDQSY